MLQIISKCCWMENSIYTLFPCSLISFNNIQGFVFKRMRVVYDNSPIHEYAFSSEWEELDEKAVYKRENELLLALHAPVNKKNVLIYVSIFFICTISHWLAFIALVWSGGGMFHFNIAIKEVSISLLNNGEMNRILSLLDVS